MSVGAYSHNSTCFSVRYLPLKCAYHFLSHYKLKRYPNVSHYLLNVNNKKYLHTFIFISLVYMQIQRCCGRYSGSYKMSGIAFNAVQCFCLKVGRPTTSPCRSPTSPCRSPTSPCRSPTSPYHSPTTKKSSLTVCNFIK